MSIESGIRSRIAVEDGSGSLRAFGNPAAVLFSIALSMVLRALVLLRYKVDSDESQHLHVAWSWSRGLEQYRDVFDNHMPLFHMLFAPLAGVVGERADILFWMRLSMLPLLAATLACTYVTGKRLFSPAVGLWAAILVSISTGFLLSSTEFRTDNLWAVLWMAAVAVIVSGPLTSGRTFLTGVLLGLCFTVSLKSVLLVGALGLGAVASGSGRSLARRLLRRCALFAAGVIAPIAVISTWFFATGAGRAFIYCTVRHNMLPQLGHASHPERGLIALVAIPLIILASRLTASEETRPDQRRLRVLIFVAALSYLALLVSFWPLIPRQDYLPIYPLVYVFLTAGIFALPRPSRLPALSAVVAASLLAFLRIGVIAHDQTSAQTNLLRDVLRLAAPSDPVMDTKGETVFRNRPFYYVLETITQQRLVRGLIPDEIREQIIRTRTCVVTEDSWRYPPAARNFLNDHYVSVGLLRVPGRVFQNATRARFDVPFTASYALVASGQPVTGALDGSPYAGPRFLSAGVHEFVSTSRQTVAFVWSAAIARGFSPFARTMARNRVAPHRVIPYTGLVSPASIPHF